MPEKHDSLDHETEQPAKTTIKPEGGAVTGDVNTGGGDFVGRDKITHIYQTTETAAQLQAQRKEQAMLRDGTYTRLPFEPETVLIPAGSFLMGDGAEQHEVSLPDYRIGKFPVMNEEYAHFLQQNKAYPMPQELGWFSRRPPEGKERHPVVGVNWHDVAAYCTWLTGTTERAYWLPTEAEWEKAALWETGAVQLGRKRIYPWGDQWCTDCCALRLDATAPVDAHPNGISAYGCWDLFGNVQEWTNTLWGDDYAVSRYPPPYNPKDGREERQPGHLPRVLRIHRGGSYRDEPASVLVNQRGRAGVGNDTPWRGFRVALHFGQLNQE